MTDLVATGITKAFGGLRAVDNVTLTVPAGRVTSLIGPNGAGKTTFFNCLTGLLEPDEGEVRFGDDDLTALETHERARLGVGRTFQRLEVFTGLSVFENLQVAAEATSPGNTFLGAFKLRHRPDPDVLDRVDAVLERLDLGWAARRVAGDLPTGVLRLVELGRSLCTNPKVMLLDELASGLDEAETDQLAAVLTGIAVDGIGILLIEHDIEMVLSISQNVYVLDFGRIIASGTPREVVANPVVQAAYIGAERGQPAAKKSGRRRRGAA